METKNLSEPIVKWRKEAEDCAGDYEDNSSDAYSECADDLERVLRAYRQDSPCADCDLRPAGPYCVDYQWYSLTADQPSTSP